jgi:plasmid stabilization system protein ParE
MTYRVELTARAGRNLRHIFAQIDAGDSAQARAWFNGLETAVLSLAEHPARSAVTPENSDLRHLLYGGGRSIYRVIYRIDETRQVVTVVHVRHGARQPLSP